MRGLGEIKLMDNNNSSIDFSLDNPANDNEQSSLANENTYIENNSFDWEQAPETLEERDIYQDYQSTNNVNDGNDVIKPNSNPISLSTSANNQVDSYSEKSAGQQINLDLRDEVVADSYNNIPSPSSSVANNANNTNNANNVSSYGTSSNNINSNITGLEVDNTSNSYPDPYPEHHNENGYDAYYDSIIDRNLVNNDPVSNSSASNSNPNNTNNANNAKQENNGSSDADKATIDLEEDDEIENNLPLSQPQTAMQRAKAKVSPGGEVSKRVIAVAIFAIAGVLFFWSGTSKKQSDFSDNKSQVIRPVPIEKSNLSNSLNSPEIGQSVNSQPMGNMAGEQVASSTPTMVEVPPPVIIPAPPPAPPPLGSGDIPITVSEPVKVEKPQRQYAFQLRAGQQVMKSYEQQQAQLQTQQLLRKEENSDSTKLRAIARGTTIPMMMIQPFRNDLPGVVKCQVMIDVKDSKGALLIAAGSIASVPFAPFRNDKRVFNRVDSPTVINLADGREIELKGTVIDRKGFVGLEGKVRRSGDANFAKRVGRTMAKVLTFGAASAVGGVGGGVISEAGNSSVDSTYFYTATTGSYVELPIGTTFIFSVSGS